MIKKSNIKFIDLGLPSGILWSDRNFNNNKYYSWGDLIGYSENQIGKEKIFNWDYYRFNKKGELTKYNDSDKLRELQPGDDIVTQTLGKNYRIPRAENFEELLKYTKLYSNFKNITLESIINENKLNFYFFGYASGNQIIQKNHFIGLWSSSSCDLIHCALYLESIFNKEDFSIRICDFYFGLNIRPVKL